MSSAVPAITMPKWGLTMTEGTVVGWLKQQGQRFAEGEEILEIETPKITNVVEAPSGGTLRRIVAPAGTTLPIGALLAVVAADEVPEAEIDAFVAGFAVVEPSTSEEAQAEAASAGWDLVIVDEATPRCSIATDIAALVADKAFAALKAPVRRVTAPHTPVPFAPVLEKLYIPSPERIAAAIREVHAYAR